MRLALFGGTFDPVHSGHLSAAHAALESFALDQILFVPAACPPHKRDRSVTSFPHRYAMVALACSGAPAFLPSLLEYREHEAAGPNYSPNYSIDTIRDMNTRLGPADRLYFIIGADAFLGVPEWREPVALLNACDFIVVSRPGFSIHSIEEVLPRELRAHATEGNSIALQHTELHLLPTVNADVSSSTIRRRAAQGEPLEGLVPEAVADYIRKTGLYLDEKAEDFA